VLASGPATRVGFKGWVFDRLSRELRSPQNVVVALSSAEFRLLVAFVDHPPPR
jgi:two-component system OmpR family response regulator